MAVCEGGHTVSADGIVESACKIWKNLDVLLCNNFFSAQKLKCSGGPSLPKKKPTDLTLKHCMVEAFYGQRYFLHLTILHFLLKY